MFLELTLASTGDRISIAWASIRSLSDECKTGSPSKTAVRFMNGDLLVCVEPREYIIDQIKRLKQMEGM